MGGQKAAYHRVEFLGTLPLHPVAGLAEQVEVTVGQTLLQVAANPYVAVVGPREAPEGLVALRLRDGRQLPAMPYAEAIALVGAVSAAPLMTGRASEREGIGSKVSSFGSMPRSASEV